MKGRFTRFFDYSVAPKVIPVMMFILIFIIAVAGIVSINRLSKEKNEEKVSSMISFVEYAYMEGQRDAIEGDIRIKKIGDDYVWIKSPWDDEEKPAFKYLSEYGFE